MMKYLIMGVGGIFALLVIIYFSLQKKLMGKKTKYVASLTTGTKSSGFSLAVLYQKFYIQSVKIPFLRRYALKLRRRLEIINLEDEFITRQQVAKILLKAIPVAGIFFAAIIIFTRNLMNV